MWSDEGQSDRFDHLQKTWILARHTDPIFVVDGGDGEFYIWDGNHRVAVSVTHGLLTIPAIVGVRR